MATIKIKRGKDLRIAGRPERELVDGARPSRVALKPTDFRYLRPRLKIKEGDSVSTGTPLFESKDDPRVKFVSPGSGRVEAVRFGQRRKLLEVVVALSGEERFEEAGKLSAGEALKLSREELIERLLNGGLWPLILQRPFSRIASPSDKPKSIFVGAMAEDAFAPDPEVFLKEEEPAFQLGLEVLKKLTDGPLHLCVSASAKAIPIPKVQGMKVHRFSGPYPSGSVPVQIYYAGPPRGHETVWYLQAADVLAVSRYLTTGRFPTERIVALSGPAARERRFYRSRFGASVESIAQGRVETGELRYVSGGVLTGSKIAAAGFLGFYDTTLFVLAEGRQRELLSFAMPGFGKYSLSRAFFSGVMPSAEYSLDTSKRGSPRNFVLNGIYEDLCPVNILPQHLVKAVLAGDIEETERHGILDCAQCGLCTFVCPSKVELGSIIQDGLDTIIKEG